MTNTATENQIKFINTLKDERDMSQFEPHLESARGLWRKGRFEKDVASRLIDALKTAPLKKQAPRVYPKIESGRYAVEVEAGCLAFYRIQNTPGFDYPAVYLQAGDDERRVSMKQAGSALTKIAADPKAASLAYGHEIGRCGVCGRTLTDATSRARGIGPVCADKLGW